MAENPISKTTSVCPDCLKIIHATIFERDGKVWIKKRCGEHGAFEELYWGDYAMYTAASKYAHDGDGIENPAVRKETPACPMDCGLCKEHKTHTALANVAVTNRCDLACWYCFYYARKDGYVYEPTLDQLRQMFRTLVNERPISTNALQLTGGEPTLRPDIVDIIKIAKEEDIDHVQLNTNGIRLSQDAALTKAVREAGVNTIYLSFDGVTPETNPKNHWEVSQLMTNCRSCGMGVVLVPTLIRGVNDHELGDILNFASSNIDIVHGVNFQPVSLVGRMPKKEREKYRITIPDAVKRIEEQTSGEINRDDFYPVPCTAPMSHFVGALAQKNKYEFSVHFACGMATYVFKDGEKLIPITRFVDVAGLLEYLQQKSDELLSGKNKYVVGLGMLRKLGSFIDLKKQPKGLKAANLLYDVLVKHDYEALRVFHHKTLFIGLMHFQDLYNYDIERVKRCGVHYATPDGRIIPFCAFNVLPSVYRDRIQEGYGMPTAEWEKRNGRTLKDDMYVRNRG